MHLEMTKAQYEALPKRADLVNDPVENQYYRDENGGAVQVRVVPAGQGLPFGNKRMVWEGYVVALTDG